MNLFKYNMPFAIQKQAIHLSKQRAIKGVIF